MWGIRRREKQEFDGGGGVAGEEGVEEREVGGGD